MLGLFGTCSQAGSRLPFVWVLLSIIPMVANAGEFDMRRLPIAEDIKCPSPAPGDPFSRGRTSSDAGRERKWGKK
jgi:hypothetical protein